MSEQRFDSIPECFSFQFSLEEHRAPIVWLAWSPDGNSLASCSADGSVIVWATETGKSRGRLSGHSDAVVSLAWAPNRTVFASGSYDQRVLIWKANSLEPLTDISLQHGEVNDLAWSPDGQVLAAACGDGTVVLLDGREFKMLRTIEVAKDSISSIQFALDGSTLITSALKDGLVQWDANGWFPIRKIESGESGIFDISLSPDGKWLATAGDGDGIALWDTTSWSRSFTLKGHTDDISCVRFSFDGGYLASKSFDDTLRLWDIRAQKEMARLSEPSQNYWLAGFAWHPHKLDLASLGNGDTIIRLWKVLPEPVVDSVSSRIFGKGSTRVRPEVLPVPKPPPDLIRACLDNNCVVFAGAGLASPAGLPIWNDFVQRLVAWAVNEGVVNSGIAESLQEALAIGNSAQVADIVVSEIYQSPKGQAKLNNYLAEMFTSQVTAPPDTYDILKDIGFFAALTTNFDNLLESTFDQAQAFTPQDTDQLMVRLQSGEFFVLKLYGTIERPTTLLLSPAQYESHVSENIVFSQFMESLFVSKTLFFVGASLEGIEVYLKALKIGSAHLTRRHYAYVNVVGNAWKVKADILERRYGIKVIPFAASTDFREVADFLTSIRNKLERRRTRDRTGEAQIKTENKAPILKSVELRNIGPFDELTFQLDKTWNVLLGDNGVGKSSILKAISLAFIGDDGRSFADRLVKSGCSTASITLDFDGDEGGTKYITTISITDSGALVRATPSAPIRMKDGLALGFPALRTISWDRNTEFSLTGRERPLPEDLIPLIEGKPDPRLDALRSWILFLDHVIGSPESSLAMKRRYEGLRDKFFSVIRELTPGLKVHYKGVDLTTKKVLVETDDGIVPIEMVSQGTTSLLGWIGVFLQRYFDIYGHSGKTDQHALVLIDEIDAHMHPKWQQMVVGRLSHIFPNVQFIATTHSPLIVGGMPPQQVHRFLRGEDGKVVKTEVLPDMTIGYSDQILTSELFGLETGLDSITQESQKSYQKLLAMSDRSDEQEVRLGELEQDLMFRIPPPLGTYSERREAMLEQADLMSLVGSQLEAMGDENDASAGTAIRSRGEKLISDLGGDKP